MKKFLFLSIILLICSTIQTSAQVRKNTKARPVKSVSIPQKNNTQDSKATSQPVKKIAIYSKTYSKGGSIFVGKKKIFYVEVENKNNAVKSIDCQTGTVETVIPGIAGIYEGARPVIESVAEVGDYLLFVLKKGGVYVWDGKSVETSKRIPNSWDIQGSNDRYIFISFVYDQGKASERTVYSVMDTKDWSICESFKYSKQWEGKVYLASDGSAWSFHSDFYIKNSKGEDIDCIQGYGAERVKGNKNTYYNLYDLPYVSMSNDERGHYLEWGTIQQLGDSLYISVSRRIFRLDMLAENPKWEEFARLPATQPGYFGRICINRKGDMLSYYNKYSDADIQLWKAGHYDQPKNYGRELLTGFNEWNFRSLGLTTYATRIDCNDNFLIPNGEINLWNPDGIVGYEKAKGKIIQADK